MTKDPLRDLIFRRSAALVTPSRALKTAEEEPRSLLRKSQITGLQQQDSSGSVLADIETQPEEGERLVRQCLWSRQTVYVEPLLYTATSIAEERERDSADRVAHDLAA